MKEDAIVAIESIKTLSDSQEAGNEAVLMHAKSDLKSTAV